MENNWTTIPAVALRGMTILPGMIAHFDVSREMSLKAVEAAMTGEQKVFLVTQRDVEVENPTKEDLYGVGIIAEVKQVIKLQNNIVRILVEGLSRAVLLDFTDRAEYLEARVEACEEDEEYLPDNTKQAMVESIQETFGRYASVNNRLSAEIKRQVMEIQELDKLMDYISNNLPVRYEEKQKILEAVEVSERYQVLLTLLLNEIEVNAIKNEFQAKVKQRVDKHQREYLLREQMLSLIHI